MNKPKAPKRPLKNQSAPTTIEYVSIDMFKYNSEIMFIETDKIVDLVKEKYKEDFEDLVGEREDGFYDHDISYNILYEKGFSRLDGNSLTKENISKIISFASAFNDFTIKYSEGEYPYLYLIVQRTKPEGQHKKEMDAWSNRFANYYSKRKKYEKELAKYEQYKRLAKKEKLQKELEKLENKG